MTMNPTNILYPNNDLLINCFYWLAKIQIVFSLPFMFKVQKETL